MKPLRKHLKLIALLLSVAVMLQSCNIYKSRVSTIEEAVESKRRVKIKLENVNLNELLFLNLPNRK